MMNSFKKKLFNLNNVNSVNDESINSRLKRIMENNGNEFKYLNYETINVKRSKRRTK